MAARGPIVIVKLAVPVQNLLLPEALHESPSSDPSSTLPPFYSSKSVSPRRSESCSAGNSRWRCLKCTTSSSTRSHLSAPGSQLSGYVSSTGCINLPISNLRSWMFGKHGFQDAIGAITLLATIVGLFVFGLRTHKLAVWSAHNDAFLSCTSMIQVGKF